MTEDQGHHRLKKHFISAFLTQGIGALLLLFLEMYVARIIGMSNFGVFSLVTAWVYILSLLGTLGLNQCILRFLPVYLSQANWPMAKGIRYKALIWSGLFSCVLALLGLFFFTRSHTNIQAGIITVAFLMIPLNATSMIQQAMVRAFGHIQAALTPEYLIKPISFILIVCIASATMPRVTLNHALLFSITSAILGLAFITFKQSQYTPETVKNSLATYDSRHWLSASIPLLLIVGFNLVSGRIGSIMLGFLSTPESVAIYSAASKIADAVIFGLATANAVVAPMISKLYANGEHGQLQKTIQKASKYVFFFTIPISIVILLFGTYLLMFFGPQFTEGYSTLAILVTGQMVNALSGPVAYLLTMTGNHILTARVVAFSALLNVILSALLIPKFNYVGAAFATCISVIVWNVIMAIICQKKLNIKPYFIRP